MIPPNNVSPVVRYVKNWATVLFRVIRKYKSGVRCEPTPKLFDVDGTG